MKNISKKLIDNLKTEKYINEIDFGYESKFSLTEFGKS